VGAQWVVYAAHSALFAIFAVAAVWFLLKPDLRSPQDIVGVAEATAANVGALLLSAALLLMNISMSVRLAIGAWRAQSLLTAIAAIPAALVVFAACWAYWGMGIRLKRGLVSQDVRPADETTRHLLLVVAQLSRTLGIARSPNVIVSPRVPSPFCYGAFGGTATLLLPADLSSTCRRASQHNTAVAELLLRFAVGHELAHIKHRDCAVTSWLVLFYSDLRAVVTILGPLVLACAIWPIPHDLFSLLGTQAVLTCMGLPLLKWSLARVARHREFLADARIAQHFTDEQLPLLMEGQGNEAMSPMETLVTLLSMRARTPTTERRLPLWDPVRIPLEAPSWPTSTGRRNHGAASWWRAAFTHSHPSVPIRCMAIRERTHAGAAPPVPNLASAAHAHATAAFCFFVCLILLEQALLPLLAMALPAQTISQTRPLILTLAAAVPLFYPPIALSNRAITSWRGLDSAPRYATALAVQYLGGMLLGLLLVGVALAPMILLFENGLVRFAAIISASAVAQLIGLVIAFERPPLSISRAYQSIHPTLKDILRSCRGFGTALVAVGALISPIAFRGDPIAFMLAVAAGWMSLLLFALPAIEAGDAVEQFLVLRLGRRLFCLDGPTYRRWSLFTLVAICALPFATCAWLVAPAATAISRPLAQADVGSRAWLLALSAVFLVFAIMVCFWCGAAVGRNRSRFDRYALQLHWYLGILTTLGRKSGLPGVAGDAAVVMEQYRLAGGGYAIRRGGRFTCMEVNHYAWRCLCSLPEIAPAPEPLICWVRSCRCPGGGYALVPSGLPRLSATFWACRLLADAGALPLDRERDVRWIMGTRVGPGRFADRNSKHDPMEATWYAVCSLGALGALPSIDPQEVAGVARSAMQGPKVKPLEAFRATEVLEQMGMLDAATREEVYRRFVEPWMVRLPHVPVESNLGFLDAYARCLAYTRDVDPQRVAMAMDVLKERTERALAVFVKSAREPRQ
jgi:Zn-dependent protease with chaperone function